MRRIASVLACAAIIFSALVLAPTSTPAQAITDQVSFSADTLPTWQANERVWAAAGTAGGKVVVGGGFSQLRPPNGSSGSPVARQALAVLDAETGTPTSCVLNTTISGGTGTVRAAVTAPDGRTVYVAGNFTNIGGVAVTRVAAIDVPTCSVKSMRPANIAGPVWSLALHGNTLYLGGIFNQVGGQVRNKYAAVDATTGALLPWTANATIDPNRTEGGMTANGWAVAVSPDGSRVAVSGEFDLINDQRSHAFAVVDAASGAVVRAYDGGFIPWTSVGKALTTAGDTLYAGNEGTGGGVFDGRFALDWNTLEQKWRDTCLGATQAVLVHNSTLYSANHAHDCSGANEFQDGRRVYLVAQDPETMAHRGWVPELNDGIGEGIGPRALAVATGTTSGKSYLWVTGEFTRVNGQLQQSLTRFGPDDVGAPPVPSVNAEAMPDGSIQVRLRTVVDPDDSDLVYRVYRNGSATPIWTGTASSQWWTRPQVTFADTDVQPGTSYSYRVSVSDGPNTSALSAARGARAVEATRSYATAVLDAEPSLYWRYGSTSGNWVQDQSGTTTAGRNGLAEQGYSFAADGIGTGDGSLLLDGSLGYVWNDQLAPGPGTYTIQTWFRTTSTSGGKLVGYGNGRPRTDTGATQLSGNYDRQIYMENSGRLRFGIYNGAATTIRTDQAYNDGQWHQVVATQGSDGLQLYVDGQPIGSNPANNAQSYFGVWHVGGDQMNGWPDQPSSNFFGGSIDETAIYDRVLTRAEIAAMYVAGGGELALNDAPEDEYGAAVFADEPEFYWPLNTTAEGRTDDASYFGTNDGTAGSQVQFEQPGKISDATSVRTSGNPDGTIHAPQSGALSSFTVETWVKTARGGKLIGFENSPTGNGSGYDKQIYMADDGRISFGTYIGSVQVAQSEPGFNDDRWHHVVGTQDRTGLKLYVDGAVVGTNPTTTSETGAGFWRIGGGNVGGWPDTPSNFYLDGQLDDTAVYARALTASEIGEHFAIGSNDSQAPTAPEGLTAAVDGQDVTLSWGASSDDTAVTGYRVHRGSTAGFTPDEDTLVEETSETAFTDDDVAPGRYYYTVQAVDAAGNVSESTEPVEATVADTEAPTAPGQVSVTVRGDEAEVSWAAATDDVGVTEYQLHRGPDADFAPDASTLVSTTDDTSDTETGLSRGTYHYKVVALDAAGNASAPSEAAEAEVADVVAPSLPGGLTSQVSGSDVTLGWEASTDDVGVAGYQVHRGSSADFTVAEETRIGSPTSTSFTDEDRSAGTWFYKVVAVDEAGNASDASDAARAVVADTTAPSAPGGARATVDGTSVALSWTASTDDVEVVGYRVHRGTAEGFTPGQGNQVTSVAGTNAEDTGLAAGTYYYKVLALDAAGNVSAASAAVRAVVAGQQVEPVTRTVTATADSMVAQVAPTTRYGTNNQISARGSGSSPIESYLRFDLPAAPAGTQLSGASLRVRTSTDATANSTGTATFRVLTGSWDESSVTWNTRPSGTGATLGTLTGTTGLNTAYTTELDASRLAGSTGRAVSVVMTNDSADNLRLWSREASNTGYRPQLELTYTQGSTDPAPDATAPSAPGGVTATVTGTGVALAWDAATDDTAVTGYRVHRGTTEGFTPDQGNQVANVTGTTAQDTGLAPGTHYYKVVALDAAGNTSIPSASARAVVAAQEVEPVVDTVTATADAMVAQVAPTRRYGTDNQISARGQGGSSIESYLSFDVPDAPAGMQLTGATLRVRTSTDGTADSTGTTTFAVLAGSWSEETVTWSTRPTGTGATLGTLTGTTSRNTAYTTELDASRLAGSTGQTVSLVMTNDGADNLRLWSREASSTGFRPQLELTYRPAQ